MTPLATVLLASWLALPASARTDPGGGGRALAAGADPVFEPVLRDIEARLPLYSGAEAAVIRVPARSIDLGPSSKLYRCWKLRLTGDHGKQAYDVLSRLVSLQSALKDLREKLAVDLVAYAGAAKPDPALQKQIQSRQQELERIYTTYQKLLSLGDRNGLLKIADNEMFSGRRAVSPRLKDSDYTMAYDDATPECQKKPTPAP
ncbi:MAG: hypothetical protein A2X36_07385 [Elusimicrobia bacterium GWA2_69_24]|nr:MAG: hypothetical protein A2X36_07385 [Elusimicrobia bacterium GWA2_69_24]